MECPPLLGLLFSSDDGGSMFLQKIRKLENRTQHHIPEDCTHLLAYYLDYFVNKILIMLHAFFFAGLHWYY
jgi:hypothetical protein